jgi:sec-independent protein translocase protein TatB
MFGIGFLELVVIAVVALMVFGPQKLPEVMQQIGRFVLQMRRISNQVKESIDLAMEDAQAELDTEALKKKGVATYLPPPPDATPHETPTPAKES